MSPGRVAGVWMDGGALETSSSTTFVIKGHWKEPWKTLCNEEVGEAESRDVECLQKVKRVFSSGGGGRWGGWKSRWWW